MLPEVSKMFSSPKYQLRFFFDYGAGGCLWATDELTRITFGLGPIDYCIAQKTNQISVDLLTKIDDPDRRHSTYLNKGYPLDPSPWSQHECDEFNKAIDELIFDLESQLHDFEIIDQQERYIEDTDLRRYLQDPTNFKRDH